MGVSAALVSTSASSPRYLLLVRLAELVPCPSGQPPSLARRPAPIPDRGGRVEQGSEADMFFGPLVLAELLAVADEATRFPQPFEALMDWMPDRGMHYLQ